PIIDSIAERIGSRCRASLLVSPSRPSTSGGAAPTSTVAPSASSRWKSRRLRLRSKPAYNIETGLLSIAPSRQAGACHWGGPSSWHSLPSRGFRSGGVYGHRRRHWTGTVGVASGLVKRSTHSFERWESALT